METMQIKIEVRQDMINHSKELHPIESCGYLAGKDGCVTKGYRMVNIDNSPEHFSFDPKEQFAVLKAARNEGLVLMGVYHSHPESPPRLSQEDLRLLKDPSMIYVIVSLLKDDPEIKGFRIQDEVVKEVLLEAKSQ